MEKLAQTEQFRSEIEAKVKASFERTFLGIEAGTASGSDRVARGAATRFRPIDEASAEKTKTAFSNYKHLVDRAVDVFGDEMAASSWLSSPNDDLGGQVPLQVAQKANYDLEVLEPIFIRLEHGIYF